MNKTSITINNLAFSSLDREARTRLDFSPKFSFIYGASNTGKSFAVKAIDFMLGGSKELPDITERRPYRRLEMGLTLSPNDEVVLERAIVGGDFEIRGDGGNSKILSARHNRDADDNLSNFLLKHLGMDGQFIAIDKSGTKRSLSFRDVVRLCITDETSIQSETSPALSGNPSFAPAEKNIFKYMLTGEDDSALITQVKQKDFSTGRSAQVRMLDEMLSEVNAEIEDNYPDSEELDAKLEDIQHQLDRLENEISFARNSVRSKLERKKSLIAEVSRDQQRVNDIAVTLENFDQLLAVYRSDVLRLEAIEEAGFLLSLTANETCPVCGAPPEAQVHEHALGEIEAARAAAEIEIGKIKSHQGELALTIEDTTAELAKTGDRLLSNREKLNLLEVELAAALPDSDANMRMLSEVIPKRDRVKRGLELLLRRDTLTKQRDTVAKGKRAVAPSNVQLGVSTTTAQEFAGEVGKILLAWGFPGECRTFFDLDGTFDLIIDGKKRSNNGKGVRAITHAAFKVALLSFCKTRNLPHPGFLVLDTPLITYRDPMRSKAGPLSADENVIASSDLKQKMFAHLSSLSSRGQLIIFDNADPPAKAEDFAVLEAFTNDPDEGRQGLL